MENKTVDSVSAVNINTRLEFGLAERVDILASSVLKALLHAIGLLMLVLWHLTNGIFSATFFCYLVHCFAIYDMIQYKDCTQCIGTKTDKEDESDLPRNKPVLGVM